MFTAILLLLLLITGTLAGLFFTFYMNTKKEYEGFYEEFKDVIDIKKEANKLEKEFNALKVDYSQKRSLYEQLSKEINLLKDQSEDFSFGLYEPHFSYDTSERYKIELSSVREEQKQMIRSKTAALCRREWTVAGSESEGKKMVDRTIRLMLRAFNNECDAAVLKVRWDNVTKMRERVSAAFESINKLGEPVAIEINPRYLESKLKEISLTHEYQEKLQAEKEEQRRIREQMREEEKVRREVEKALQDSIREEETYNKALEKAREELKTAHGEKLEQLKSQMAILEQKLKEAEEKSKRAQSMAELTKAGHVYIISNIGSFGKNVYKIGLTRRLEPLDRVKELGDASVPFEFDVHAMIYSENAPELETQFHRHFSDRQVNLVNPRKEFFAISLEEIEKFALTNGLRATFTKAAEAREYRETIAIRSIKNTEREQAEQQTAFPASL